MAADSGLTLPATDDDVLAKAREEVARTHELLQQRAPEGHAVPESIRQGCDITLSHMGLSRLPLELIDVIKEEVSRLALDHNRLSGLSGLSLRFSECSRLRYLVMRNNQLRDFPAPILSVPTLELLDLRGNKIESLPEDLSKLRNLRVFSVHHNRITKIPICVGQMNNLMHFATRKNPIMFPPPEEWAVSETELASNRKGHEDDTIRMETKNMKSFLLDYASKAKQRTLDGEMSEENVETPRPARRKASGRFPIKPSVSATDLTATTMLISPPLLSPMPLKPPPIPSRSFARLPNQPQTATIRPPLAPLVTLSERNRSNSESQMSTTLRAKRMGIIPRKPVAPASLDMDKTNRLSHFRGLSHGSALQNGAMSNGLMATDSSSPTSPVEGELQRGMISRRLSSLPEGKRKSHTEDPIVNLASGMLYALDQIHAPIKSLTEVLKDGKRTRLELNCQVAFSFAEELDRVLIRARTHDEENEEEERQKVTASIRASCETCIKAFEQLVSNLRQEIPSLVMNANPQYIRTLLHMLYASLIEVRNACSKLGVEFHATPDTAKRDVSRGRFISPDPSRPLTSLRVRDRTPILNGSRSSSRNAPPAAQRSIPLTASSRTGSMSSLNSAPMNSATIRPSDPFNPFGGPSSSTRMSRSNTLVSVDEMEEEQQFERIFLKLSSACDFALQALPRCHVMVTESKKLAAERGAGEADFSMYEVICDRCKVAIDAADALKKRLSTLMLKEKGIRSQLDFWQLCTAFTRAYFMFAGRVKDCYQAPVSLIPEDIKLLLKPVQRSVKDVSKFINDSPWGYLAATPGQQPVMSASNHNIKSFNAATMNSINTMTTNLNNAAHPLNAPLHQHQPQYSRTNPYKQPALTLSTRSPLPPANPLDPLSASSTHSNSSTLHNLSVTPTGTGPITTISTSGGPPTIVSSGYVTPLPATPMSAALGPAAGATVPLPQTIIPTSLPIGVTGATPGMMGGAVAAIPHLPAGGLGASAMPLGGGVGTAVLLPGYSVAVPGASAAAAVMGAGAGAASAHVAAASASFPAPGGAGLGVGYFAGGVGVNGGGGGGLGGVGANGAGKMEAARPRSQSQRR